jgi:hypothetical protein
VGSVVATYCSNEINRVLQLSKRYESITKYVLYVHIFVIQITVAHGKCHIKNPVLLYLNVDQPRGLVVRVSDY